LTKKKKTVGGTYVVGGEREEMESDVVIFGNWDSGKGREGAQA
jgi:hypothetical protein